MIPLLGIPLAAAAPATVVTSTERLTALTAPPVEPEVPPDPIVARREVTLTPAGADAVEVHARWSVRVPAPRTVSWVLAGPQVAVDEVRLGGERVSAEAGERGTVLSALLTGDTAVELRGTVPRAAGVAAFELLPAAAGAIAVPAGDEVAGAIPVGPGRAVGGGGALAVRPASPRAPARDLLVGESALGITLGDAEIQVRAVVRFHVIGRPIDRVEFDAVGASADLDVRGPQVASWASDGDRVEVQLRSPEATLVALDVGWSSPTPGGEENALPIPRVVPREVFRNTAAIVIGRDPELDAEPALGDGWTAVAPAALPGWGRGLAAGSPAGAFTGRGDPGKIDLRRFTPAEGPATLVDVASYSGLWTEEGRVLLRATYAVRNDRGAALRVTAPAGLAPIGVQVGGRAATVARDGDAWLVPLEKSVETVQGLLAFPIEILFVGDLGPVDLRRGAVLPLPTVDAEIAVARLSVTLPRGWSARVPAGRGDAVGDFTVGDEITYGYAVGDARGAQAAVLFQEAVDAWKANDFAEARDRLDALDRMGAASPDLARLRSNLEVIDRGASAATERRVVEQARARAMDQAVAQQQALAEAEEAMAAGAYEEAEQAYQRALELGGDLAKLQAKDDLAQEQVNRDAAEKLSAAKGVRAQKEAQVRARAGANEPAPAAAPDPPRRTGALRVTAIDPDELPVPAATLRLTGAEESLRTNEHGEALFAELPPGSDYRLVVTSEDFGGVTVEGIAILENRVTPVTVRLAPSEVEQVEVYHRKAVETNRTTNSPILMRETLQRIPAGRVGPPATQETPPVVSASALGIVLPPGGEIVRYQRLLLPAGTPWAVEVRGRP